MGNENSSAAVAVDLKNFPMQKYLNQGLKQQEIIKIKQAFDSYHPENGRIKVASLFETTEQSGSHDAIHRSLQGKETLNFDQFFNFSKQLIEEQIRKNPTLIIDASEVQASCLFCPYTHDFLSTIICPFILFYFFGSICFENSPQKVLKCNQFLFQFVMLIVNYQVLCEFIYYLSMGFFKIMAFIAVPITGMTYAAFSLGKELPKASRKFGNYIGLSYVYFKCVLKTLKPEDQMPYDMIQMARKASQQSQALRRQLRNTVKRAKEDFHRKHEETMSNFQQKIKMQKTLIKVQNENESQQKGATSQASGSEVMRELLQIQQRLAEAQRLKKQSRTFYEKI